MAKMFFACAILVAVFFFSNLISADIGPGPDPPSFTLTLVSNGATYSGPANVTYLCSKATDRNENPQNSVAPYDLELKCEKGICTNSGWYYKFNQCFYSSGKFQAIVNGQTFTSDEVSLEKAGTYTFTLDVTPGGANGCKVANSTVNNTGDIAPPQPKNGLCGLWFIPVGLLGAAFFVRR
ncbi:Uncharacterised protein [Candidatus Gugararchaeum adminiculabundum]|nr:Uncharacterised protein [Candidatus Gugararchaeum adminiculabundum]